MLKAMTTIEFCEKSQKQTYDSSVYDRGTYGNLQAVLGDYPLLWLLPVCPPSGTGLTFAREGAPLLAHPQPGLSDYEATQREKREAAERHFKALERLREDSARSSPGTSPDRVETAALGYGSMDSAAATGDGPISFENRAQPVQLDGPPTERDTPPMEGWDLVNSPASATQASNQPEEELQQEPQQEPEPLEHQEAFQDESPKASSQVEAWQIATDAAPPQEGEVEEDEGLEAPESQVPPGSPQAEEVPLLQHLVEESPQHQVERTLPEAETETEAETPAPAPAPALAPASQASAQVSEHAPSQPEDQCSSL